MGWRSGWQEGERLKGVGVRGGEWEGGVLKETERNQEGNTEMKGKEDNPSEIKPG